MIQGQTAFKRPLNATDGLGKAVYTILGKVEDEDQDQDDEIVQSLTWASPQVKTSGIFFFTKEN